MSGTGQRVPGRPRFGLFQALLAVGLLVLVWYSFGRNVLAPAGGPVVPERLGNLELVRSVDGAEAIAQISKLHGVAIQLKSASVAEYASRSERVTVWAGDAESESAAAGLIERMIKGIDGGGSGYSNVRRLTVGGNDIWQVDGAPEGSFFFYHSRQPSTRVVWLTVESANPRPLVEVALRSF